MSHTLTTLLPLHGITIPDELIADAEIPVLTEPQRQGDVMIIPLAMLSAADAKIAAKTAAERAVPVTAKGVAVVRGEATGNTHLLHADPGSVVSWVPGPGGTSLLLGLLTVESGVAWLIHTDEHGANGIGPGQYSLHGKQEQADLIRRVAD